MKSIVKLSFPCRTYSMEHLAIGKSGLNFLFLYQACNWEIRCVNVLGGSHEIYFLEKLLKYGVNNLLLLYHLLSFHL
jgi:hypothetical protein